MRWDGLWVAGLGTYLPEQVQTAREAVAAGRYDAGESMANGISAVRVARPDEAPAVMAAAAGRQAATRSGHRAEEFGLVLHAGMGHQGQDFWTPASYVQRETIGGTGPAVEVRQGSNGGLAALELAASHLTARPDRTAVLVTTGDAFHRPYIDRWNSDNQQVYGDGAGALVLSSRTGFARLRAMVSLSDATLEPIYRGTSGWTAAPFQSGAPVDLRRRKRDHLLQRPELYDETIQRMTNAVEFVLRTALDEAKVTVDEIAYTVHATLAETIVSFTYHHHLGLDRARTTYDWGRDLGHLGAGDELVGLTHLLEERLVAPGDLVLALGAGIGYCWTAAVLEIADLPAW